MGEPGKLPLADIIGETLALPAPERDGFILRTCRALAAVRCDEGRANEADRILHNVLPMLRTAMGAEDPDAVKALGRSADAEATLLGVRRAAGPAHADACLPELVRLYEAWNIAEPGRGYDQRVGELKLKASPPSKSKPGER